MLSALKNYPWNFNPLDTLVLERTPQTDIKSGNSYPLSHDNLKSEVYLNLLLLIHSLP